MTAVLLDIDGTLVDTNYLHVDAWARALLEVGVTVPRASLHRQIGKGSDQLLPMFVRDPAARARSDERHLAIMAELDPFAKPLPGARELIEALAADGHALWLATSAKQATTSAIPAAARSQAQGLATPSRPPMVEGSPKTLLPMTALSTSPVSARRPMVRRRGAAPGAGAAPPGRAAAVPVHLGDPHCALAA